MLNTKEIAEKLSKPGQKYDSRDVAKLAREGAFPNAHKDNRRWAIPHDDLKNYLRMQKIINAFNGVIRTYRFEPLNKKTDHLWEDYTWTMLTYSIGEETVQLFYEKRSFSQILDMVDEFFLGQTDKQTTSRLLLDSLNDWIIAGNELHDQKKVKKAVKDFISNIEEEIKPRLIYIPIEGLKLQTDNSVALANCTLFRNDNNSEFNQLQEQYKKRWQNEDLADANFDRATSFFTYEITAHYQKGMDRGIEEAQLSLRILRLYIGSYYFHENKNDVVQRMGIAGSLHLDERLKVFCISPDIPISDQYPGSRERSRHHENFAIGTEQIEAMQETGLNKINKLLLSLDSISRGDDLARRMVRAITWFAKGTTAKKIADSYLMYAIAIEGLLSEGRTSQETYATRMAALVTGTGDNLIVPMGGYISPEFGKELKEASSLNNRYNLIQKKIVQLFIYRNKIAHGAVLSNEVDERNLLDFETMVRNSILSFAVNKWNTLSEFKDWVNKSIGHYFNPSR